MSLSQSPSLSLSLFYPSLCLSQSLSQSQSLLAVPALSLSLFYPSLSLSQSVPSPVPFPFPALSVPLLRQTNLNLIFL
jgi:hypothetical protein